MLYDKLVPKLTKAQVVHLLETFLDEVRGEVRWESVMSEKAGDTFASV